MIIVVMGTWPWPPRQHSFLTKKALSGELSIQPGGAQSTCLQGAYHPVADSWFSWVSTDVNLGENCDDASLILYSRRPVLGVPLINKTFHSSEPLHRLFSVLSIPAYSRGPAEGTSSAKASPSPTGRTGLLLARCSWPSTVTSTRRGSCSFKLRSPPRTVWELLKDKHFFSPSCNRRPRSTRIFRMFVMYKWTSAFNRRSPSR